MYKRGDLVWAKMKGFPPWPGIIAAPPDELKKQPAKKSTLYHCIFFFGSKNYSWIEAHKLDRYKKGTGTISGVKRSAGLREAIAAIDAYIETGEGSEDFDITPEVDVFDKLLNESKAAANRNSSSPPAKKKFKQGEEESDGDSSDSSSGSISCVLSTSAVNLNKKSPNSVKKIRTDVDKQSHNKEIASDEDDLSNCSSGSSVVIINTVVNKHNDFSEKMRTNVPEDISKDRHLQKAINKESVTHEDDVLNCSSGSSVVITKTILNKQTNVSDQMRSNVHKDVSKDKYSQKVINKENVSDEDEVLNCSSGSSVVTTKTILNKQTNVSDQMRTNVHEDQSKEQKMMNKDIVSDDDLSNCSSGSSVVITKTILNKQTNVSDQLRTNIHKDVSKDNQTMKVTNKDIIKEKVLDKDKELVKDKTVKVVVTEGGGPSCSKDNSSKPTSEKKIDSDEKKRKEMAIFDENKYTDILGIKKNSFVNLGERVPIDDYWIRSFNSPEVKIKVPTRHPELKKKRIQQVVKARPFSQLPKVIKMRRKEGASSSTKKRNNESNGECEPKKKKRLKPTAASSKRATTTNNAEPNLDHEPTNAAAVTLEPPQISSSRPTSPRLDLFTVPQSLLDKHITPSTLRFGFLGLGIMGSVMVKNLLSSGHRVIVWNKTPDKCRDFARVGAEMAVTPQDVCTAADIIFSCVAGPKAAKEMVFGNCGALAEMNPSKAYVEMTNIDTETSLDINEAIISRGARYLEAQIQGSLGEAEEGKLVLLCAGDRSLYEECHSCFEAIGYSSFFFGDVGNATKMNLVIQMMCATVIAGLAESMALIEKLGLLQSDMIDIINLTPLKSKLIMEKARFMKNCTFPTNLSLNHMQTDIRMGINSAEDIGVPTPIFSAVNEEFKHSKHMGYGEHDVAAIYVRSRY